jgi:DNA (cytosine-5)-methyltransferase 1
LKARDFKGPSSDGDGDGDGAPIIAHALRGEGFDASEDGTGRGTPIIAVHGTQDPCVSNDTAFALGRNNGGENAIVQLVALDTTQITSAANFSNPQPNDPCHPLAAGAHAPAIAFSIQERAVSENPNAGPQGAGWNEERAFTLEARNKVQAVASMFAVRRLTPRECERLQGFPDDFTAIPWRGKPADQCPDGP